MTEVMLNGLRTCLRPVADESERVRAAELLMADDLGLFALPMDDPGQCLWLVIDKSSNAAVGAACVGDLQQDGSRGYWLVIDSAQRGTGLGSEAMRLGLAGLRRDQTLRLLVPVEQRGLLDWLHRFDLEFVVSDGHARTEVRAERADRPLPATDAHTWAQVVEAMCDALDVPAALRGKPEDRVSEPVELVCAGRDRFGRLQWLASGAAEAFARMRDAAAADGVTLELVSGFRSAAYQSKLVQRKRERGDSWDAILGFSALPGYSEHHSGHALDLAGGESSVLEHGFESTPAFAWLQQHGGRFGFSLSYPPGNPRGMAYEPWHWRWNGAS